MRSPRAILDKLSLQDVNPGACAGGRWIRGEADEAFAKLDPATGELIARVTPAAARDFEEIRACALGTFRTWRMVPAPKRGELVGRIGELVRDHKTCLGELMAFETGKPQPECEGEVQEVVDMARLAVGQSRMLYGFTMQSQRDRHRMYDQWLPLGVVGVITAFNFPAAVWSWNAFIAAVCGDTVIWKPSPKTPLTAIALQRLANRAMEDLGQPGVFSLFVAADNAVAELLVRDPAVALISFTGSTAVGRRVSRIVSETLGRRSLLECSGNNAVILDETADLELAVPAICFAAAGTAGQRCTSTRRLIVHRTRIEQALHLLKAAYAQIKVGNPFAAGVLVGPLIDRDAVASFEKAVAAALGEGGELICGGKAVPGPGCFVEPTVIRAANHWRCVQDETFAPILYVMPYDEFAEAIALQNGVPQGLAAGLHTRDIGRMEEFLSAAGNDCGIAKINMGTTGADVGAAFGGEKETGGGRASGSDAWKAYMRRQSVAINWGGETPWRGKVRVDRPE
jgi:aldehyde dehydrogenase (NAD+)